MSTHHAKIQNETATPTVSFGGTAASWGQLPLEKWRILYGRFGENPDIDRLQDDGGVSNPASGRAEIPDTETNYRSIPETIDEMIDRLWCAHEPRFQAQMDENCQRLRDQLGIQEDCEF